MSHAVVWFRNDLRLHDNPAWGTATSDHDRITALFVMGTERGAALRLLLQIFRRDAAMALLGAG